MGITDSKKRPQGTFDSDLEFKDAGLVGASAAAQVDSAAQVVDVGTGLFRGCMILDVTAIEIDDSDEIFDIWVQGSTDSDFSDVDNIADLASINISDDAAKRTDSNMIDTVGRYKLYFDNERNGVFYPYLRVYTAVAGTVTVGINYSAYCVPMQ
jgi:hypothetical protein